VMNAWLESPKILRVFEYLEHLKKGSTRTVFKGLQKGLG